MINHLSDILRVPEHADFFINTPRAGYYKARTFTQFTDTFDKYEATKMHPERISPAVSKVKIWIRGFGQNSYMLETARENILINIPAN